MTSLTFIDPDGKLMTHKKYVNWEGVREVEGSQQVQLAYGGCSGGEIEYGHWSRYETIPVDFTIQD